MGTAWATAEELATLIQAEAVDRATTDFLLQQAADVVRGQVGGQQVDLLTTVEKINGPRISSYYSVSGLDSEVFLSQRIVHAIESIIEIQNDGSSLELVEDQDYTWTEGGTVKRIRGGNEDSYFPWTRRKQGIIVTYTHGYDTDDYRYGLAKQVSLQAASRAYINPEELHDQAFGGYSTRFKGNSETTNGLIFLTKYEQTMLIPLEAR